jgi:hypothetical protein
MRTKRNTLEVLIAAATACFFAVICVASAPGVKHFGPIPSTSPDSGTCGNEWANDSFDRFFTVYTTANSDGTYSVTEQFKKGTFITNAGASPGGCETNPGGTVEAGVVGKFQGSFSMIVAGGTFNPDAVCTPSTCDTTAGFVSTVFGPTATFSVSTFFFHYNAKNNGEWKNASDDRGGNHGDITGAP